MSEIKGKRRGLLTRIEGNIPPVEFYTENEPPTAANISNEVRASSSSSVYAAKKKDTRTTLKIPAGVKRELDVIRMLNKKKYDYEVIQTLIDHYIKTLSPTEFRKYNSLKDML